VSLPPSPLGRVLFPTSVKRVYCLGNLFSRLLVLSRSFPVKSLVCPRESSLIWSPPWGHAFSPCHFPPHGSWGVFLGSGFSCPGGILLPFRRVIFFHPSFFARLFTCTAGTPRSYSPDIPPFFPPEGLCGFAPPGFPPASDYEIHFAPRTNVFPCFFWPAVGAPPPPKTGLASHPLYFFFGDRRWWRKSFVHPGPGGYLPVPLF